MGVSHSISKQSIRYTDRSKDKDRVYRIPLDVAVQAVVLLQKRARIVVAKKKVEQVRQNLITSHELATNYLEQVKTRATSSSAKSLHSNNLGLARSSSVMAMAKARCNLYPTDKLATKAFHYLFTREHSPAAIIYPLVGFVVQAKLQSQTSSGISYDVFINLCHHPYISQMTGTLPRLQPMSASATTKIHGHSTRQQDAATTATSFDTLPGLAAAGGDNRVAIVFDVLISSLEYDDEFVYMDGVGVIPLRKNSKEKFATAVINYLNSQDFLSRINTKTLVPLFQQVFMDVSRGSIGLDFYLPRLPRPYVGDISPLVLRKSGEEQLLHYLESSATQNPTSNHTGSVPNTPATAASTSPRYASNNLLSSDSLTQVRKVPPVIQGWLTLGNGMYDVPRQSMDEIDFSSALSSSQRAKEHRGNENLFDGLVDEGEEDDYEFIKHRHTISQKLKAEKLQETSGNESVYAVLNCGVLTLYRQRSTLSEDTEGTKPSYINNYYRNEMSTYNNTAVAGESELIPPNCEEIVRFILCSHAVNTEMSTGNGVFAVHFVPLTALPVAAESMTYSLTSSPRSRALNAASDNGRKLHDFSSIPPLASQYRASPTMIRDCISLFFNRAKSHTLEGYNLYDSGIDPISKDMDDRQLARSKKESPKATKEKVTNSENKLTLKFHSFSEILTWKLYIAEHMNFSADRIRTVIGASQLDFSTVADTIERSQSSSPRVVSGAGHGNRMRMMESIDEREQLEEAGADKEENDVTSHCRVNGAIDGADIVRPSEMLKNERKSITTFDEIVENTEDMPFADLANPINSSATTASPVFEELKLNRKTEVRLQDNNMDGISNTDKPVRKSFIKLAGFKESSILPHSHHTENGSRVLDEKDFHAKTVKSKNEVTQSTRIANDVEISQTKKDEHEEYKKVPEQRMALPVVPPIDTSAPQRNFHDPLADDKFSPKKESAKTTLGLAKVLEYLTVPERLLIRFGGWVRVSKAVGVLSELSESQLAEMDGAIDSNSLFNDIPVYLEIDCGFMKLFYREHDPEYDELSIPFAVIPLANTVMFAQPITASEQPQIFSDGIPAAVAAIFTGTGKSISAAGSSPNADDQPTVETIGTALSVCNPGGCFPKEVLIEIIFRSDTPNFDLEYHPLYDSTAEACTMIELLETHAHYAQKYASCYMTAILYFLQSDVMFNPESVGSDWHPEECVDVFSGLLHLSTGSGSKATANRRSKTSSSVRLAETTGVSDSAAPHVIDSNNGFGVTGEQRSFFIREDVHVAEIQSQLVHSSSGSLSPRSAAESPRSLQTSMVPTPIAGLGSSGPGTHGLVEATNEISGESATGLQTLLLLSSLRRYPRYLDCVCMRLHNYLVFMSTSLFTFVTVNTMHASAIAAPKEMLGNHTASASAADTVNSDLGNQSSNWKIHLLAPNDLSYEIRLCSEVAFQILCDYISPSSAVSTDAAVLGGSYSTFEGKGMSASAAAAAAIALSPRSASSLQKIEEDGEITSIYAVRNVSRSRSRSVLQQTFLKALSNSTSRDISDVSNSFNGRLSMSSTSGGPATPRPSFLVPKSSALPEIVATSVNPTDRRGANSNNDSSTNNNGSSTNNNPREIHQRSAQKSRRYSTLDTTQENKVENNGSTKMATPPPGQSPHRKSVLLRRVVAPSPSGSDIVKGEEIASAELTKALPPGKKAPAKSTKTGNLDGNSDLADPTTQVNSEVTAIQPKRYYDEDNVRERCTKLLRAQETLLAFGLAVKQVMPTGSKEKRMLILTNSPRLIFVDPKQEIVTGQIELPLLREGGNMDVKIVSAKEFEIHLEKGHINRFTALEEHKSSMFWTTHLNRAIRANIEGLN